MRRLGLTPFFAALAASPANAQRAENMPTQITTVHLGDVKVRYLNFKWNEEAFAGLEKGSDAPEAKRGWAIVRLFPEKPIIWNGGRVSGGNLLILNPATRKHSHELGGARDRHARGLGGHECHSRTAGGTDSLPLRPNSRKSPTWLSDSRSR